MSLLPENLSPLRALSILHELTVAAMDLFDTVQPLESFLLKMASRLDARVILLWQAPLAGGMLLLGSAGLSRRSRTLSMQTVRLEQLEHTPAEVLPYPECRDPNWHFVSIQLGPEDSEYGMTLCFGAQPAPYLSGSLKQLGQMLYRMLNHRSLEDRNLHVTSRLQTVLAASPDGILLLNHQGLVLQSNPAAESLLGWTSGQLHAQSVRELFQVPEVDWLLELLGEPGHPRLGQRHEGFGRPPHEDLQMVMTLAQVPFSQPPIFALQLRDVTAPRQVEKHLRETKARLEALIENLQAGVLFESAQRKILLVNRSFCQMYGIPLDPVDLVGADCETSAQQTKAMFKDPEGFLARIHKILKQGQPVISEVVELVDGRYFEYDYIAIRAEDELVGHLWVYRDVSDKIRSEKEREVLSRFPNESPSPVLRVSTSGKILYANLPAVYLLWYLYREVGQDLEGEMYKVLQECLRKQRRIVHEMSFGRRFYQLLWVPVQDQDYINIYGTDITERRQAEQQALTSRDDALSALATKQEFLAMISHEIRTPLNAMLGMLEVLGQTQLESEQQQYLGSSREAGRNLLALINNLLDFSRLEAGQMQLNAQVFQPAQVVSEALKVFALRAQHQKLQLRSQLAPTLPSWLKGDARRFSQLLFILIDNALKFTESGEIVVELLSAAKIGEHWELCWCVRDTGIGVPPEKQELIFETFQQVDSSNTRRYGGSGLGLSIARQLVKLFQGKLWLESQPGEGSCFYFTVQLQEASGQEITQQQEVAETVWQPSQLSNTVKDFKRVLVAEDHLENQMLIRAYLRNLPFELSYAETGHEAIERWHEQDPDLILMDVQMPEMDGLDATRMIRSLPGRQVPILALTADTQSRTRDACLEAGCDEVLTKPIEQRALIQALEEHLISRPAQAETEAAATVEAVPATSADPELERPIRRKWRQIPEVAAIVPIFMEQRQGQAERILELLQAEDLAGIARLAHGMKGSGSSFGFDVITELGQALESACSRQDKALIQKLAEAYGDYIEWVQQELAATT